MSASIRALLLIIIATIDWTGVAFGQSYIGSRVKLVTVCEVIENLKHYANTAVAVVGRYERSVSLIDHYEFLAQDRCEHPVVTEGQVWPNTIQVFLYWEEGMPKPPKHRLKLNPTLLAAKLSVIRKTTILGFHKEPQFKNDGKYSGRGDVPNEWAVAYGRIVTVSNLGKEDGGFIGAPVGMIVEPYNFHILKWVIDAPEPELR